MKAIQKTPEKIILRIDGNFGLANSIRRSVEEIPTLAIDEVEIFKNDSAVFDESLAHRIGLVPLRTDGRMGEKTEMELSLKKTGPCTVYSGDLKGPAKVIYEKIPITLLEKGQEIEFVGTARMGTGLIHTKHVPGLCYYRYLQEVKSSSKVDKIVESSKGAIKPEKKGNKWICDLNEAEIDEVLKADKDALADSDEMLFIIESFGLMEADIILAKAIEVLEKNLGEFEKNIK